MQLDLTDPRLKRIFSHYTTQHQLVKLCEEAGELTTAAAKWSADLDEFHEKGGGVDMIRAVNRKRTAFASEAADVLVLLAQVMACDDEMNSLIAEEYERKIDRQIRRIESEEVFR